MNWMTRILMLAGLLTGEVVSQSRVEVSLPHVSGAPGAILVVPVEVSDLTGLNISASDLLITYDARVVTATGIRISGTLTHRWAEASRVGFVEGSEETVGLIDIAVATANRIPSGAGVFLEVVFEILSSAGSGDNTDLVFAEAVLNEGDPSTLTVNGSITVQGAGVELLGDFNGDCIVNLADFLLFAAHFGSMGYALDSSSPHM